MRIRQVTELIPKDIWITSYNEIYKRIYKIKTTMQQKNFIKIWNKIKTNEYPRTWMITKQT